VSENSATSLDELLERIGRHPYGMPVRGMERVRAMGEAAIPALADALVRWQDDEEYDPLWPLVILGEIAHPAAVGPLVGQLRHFELEILALAAAEGLAKIGVPAVPALCEVTRTDDPLQRLYAYAVLGWIGEGAGYRVLIEALERDRELGDVIALALEEQRRPEAIPALYAAYRECPAWQRSEFERALAGLHRGDTPTPLWQTDWRLRYRRSPSLSGGLDLDWVGICAVLHGNPEALAERPTGPVRTLGEITNDESQSLDASPDTCEDCGAPIEYYTGVAACPQTAVSVAVWQRRMLEEAREDGIEDLFALLDELEIDESERRTADEPRGAKARERRRDEIDDLQMSRVTCQWLIDQGMEEVGAARALLLAEAMRLADLHGDPEGLLVPVSPPRIAGPKVGRNDPCPCGSGRKHKRCCLDKA